MPLRSATLRYCYGDMVDYAELRFCLLMFLRRFAMRAVMPPCRAAAQQNRRVALLAL